MYWICKDKKIEYGEKTLIMGIVNVTPDSFSDGNCYFKPQDAVNHALKLVWQGADIIDFGAQSTRPGYTEISPQDEWERLKPVIENFRKKDMNTPVSVDTYFPYVAEKAVNSGVDIINDVSGIINPKMAEIVEKTGCGWILMHNGRGSVKEVKDFFENSINKCKEYSIDKKQICLDMGIGFGKDYVQNLELISQIKKYKINGFPLLLATSRKRVIGQGSKQEIPEKRVFGNIAADTAAILAGVDIIRIHDVENEKQGIYMADELKKAGIDVG